MGILSSTCKQNSSKYESSYPYRHKSVDKDESYLIRKSNTFSTYTKSQNLKGSAEYLSDNHMNKRLEKSKTIKNINIHLINSSENSGKRPRKSVSLSALDQVHIIITNIDLTSSATPTKRILHDKIYSLIQIWIPIICMYSI